jgi:hypothetical protein
LISSVYNNHADKIKEGLTEKVRQSIKADAMYACFASEVPQLQILDVCNLPSEQVRMVRVIGERLPYFASDAVCYDI